jgi:hypothetical protein
MAYTINKSDGSVISTVPDGQIDAFTTSLTLIGRNYSGFGESLNENFIKLLENFSSTSQPPRAIRGQIWFDSSELKLKVYNGSAFVPVSSATLSESEPLDLGAGDLWFNTIDKQLYFYDGTDSILLGPDYSVSQGVSGLQVETILDNLNQSRVITKVFTNGILIGIISKDSFTPKIPIEGFTGSIIPGFNAGSLEGIKFAVTVTNSEALGGQPASSYVRNNTLSNIIDGQLIIISSLGITIGDANQLQLFVDDGNIVLTNIASNKNMSFNVRRGVVNENAINIDTLNRQISFYDGFSNSQVITGGDVTVNGDVTIRGNLIINDGDVTQVNVSDLVVENRQIILAESGDSSFNTDANADNGGMILKGASEHQWLWTQASGAWNSTEHINLETGKEFKINGVTVLSGTALGSGIVSIPGVTNFGPQNFVDVGPDGSPVGSPDAVVEMRLVNNRISTTKGNLDLELAPDGTGNVALQGSPKITGMADPTSDQDAATKKYVDDLVTGRSVVFSLNITDGLSNTDIANILEQVAPSAEYLEGTFARVLCTSLSNSSNSVDLNTDLTLSDAEFDTPSGTAFALTNAVFSLTNIPGQAISVTRTVKIFRVIGGSWSYVSG